MMTVLLPGALKTLMPLNLALETEGRPAHNSNEEPEPVPLHHSLQKMWHVSKDARPIFSFYYNFAHTSARITETILYRYLKFVLYNHSHRPEVGLQE
jgi:hypothetical protein